MSNYRYEGYGVVRDLKDDIPYHTDDIVDLLEEKDQQIVELQKQLKQSQKQFAIKELEKIYNLFEPYENSQKDTTLCANNDISFIDYLENRIKELGGEENE